MKNRKIKRRNLQAYDQKSGNLEKRLEKEFIDHGIATIPCKVGGIDDIISPYSVRDYLKSSHLPLQMTQLCSNCGAQHVSQKELFGNVKLERTEADSRRTDLGEVKFTPLVKVHPLMTEIHPLN